MIKKVSKYLVLLAIIFSSNLSAFGEPARIEEGLMVQNITRHLEYLEDITSTIKIDNIVANRELEWKQNENTYINFGYSRSRYWFRFTIKNPMPNTVNRLLEIDFAPIDHIHLYIPDGKGNYSIKEAGDSIPFSSKEVYHRNHLFRMIQKPGDTTYYIRIDSLDSINFILNMLSRKGYYSQLHLEFPLYFIFFGFMIVMFIYNFIIFFFTRDLAYLYFCGFIASVTLLELNIKGYANQYLWPNLPWWGNHANAFFVGLLLLFITLFLVDFVELKESAKPAFRIITFNIIIVLIIVIIVSLFLDTQTGLLVILIFTLIVTSIAYYIGIHLAFIQKPSNRQALIAVISFSLFALASPVIVLTMLGFLPANFFTRAPLQFGASAAVILLSLGLADKITNMQKSLEKGEKKYQHIVESTDDIIFSLDDSLNILSINSAVTRHLGYKEDELINTNFMDLIREALNERTDIIRQIAAEYISELKLTGERVEFKSSLKSKYGFEPKELAIKLEYGSALDTGYSILGKASPITDDILLPFLEREEFTYTLNNYLNNAELMSQRLSRNLNKYLESSEISVMRIALRESIINAIEHGNLNLSFEEKTEAMIHDRYREIIKERQKDPLNKDKIITIEYILNKDQVTYKISDEGSGFAHSSHTDKISIKLNEEMLSHGRGLVMIKDAFNEVTFNERGNQITLVKYFKE